MKVAVLGAGSGGLSAVVELSRVGHDVRLWNRSTNAIEALRLTGGVAYEGVLGEGFIPIRSVTSDLRAAAADSDVLLACLPTFAHGALARELIEARISNIPTVLNPGHTGGALEFANVFRSAGVVPPPVAEFSTLTYVARKPGPDRVNITGRAKSVRAAALPGGQMALELGRSLFAFASPIQNVLATGLSNVNLVLHPPGCILGAAWVEAARGDFTFYVQGLPDGVARVMQSLDEERRAVATAFGIPLPSLFEEMRAIGTIEETTNADAGLGAAIRAGAANRSIRAPASFSHRYYEEDFWYGLQPFLAFASIAGVDVPTAASLLQLGRSLTGWTGAARGRSASVMGIANMNRAALLEFVDPS